MSKRKNLILMLISMVLFIYIGIVSIYPMFLNASFKISKFEEKVYKAVGLVTSVGNVEFKMQPNLTLVVTIRNWSSKYIDNQDCFDADLIELYTGAFSPITKDFPIKQMFLKHVKFSNQQLPEGANKLAYIPYSFEASAFGTNKVKIKAGPVRVYDFRIKHIAPGFYKEDNRTEEKYTKAQVKEFLQKLNIRYVEVR